MEKYVSSKHKKLVKVWRMLVLVQTYIPKQLDVVEKQIAKELKRKK